MRPVTARAAMRRVAFGVAVACVASIATWAAWRSLGARGAAVPAGADVAVVMTAHPDRLVVVDLGRLRAVASVPLRSFPLDLVLDPSGRAVTSQSGGVGDDADDAVGVYDVRGGGAVRYVKLPERNPTFMVGVGDRVYVAHGMVFKSGMALSIVDPARLRTVGSGFLPDGPGAAMAVEGGRLWTLAYDPSSLEDSGSTVSGARTVVTRLDPATLSQVRVGPVRQGANQLVPTGDGDVLLLSGGADGRPASVTRIDARSGADEKRALLPGLAHGAISGCVVGRRLAVSEWDGRAEGDEGEWIEFLDLPTLRSVGRLRVSGGPCAMAAWGDRLVVIERATGRLLVVDPGAARVTGVVQLGSPAPVIADVQVLPGR